MFKKIVSIVFSFSLFFINLVKAEDNIPEYDAVKIQLKLMDENNKLEEEIIEKIKKVIKPEKQEEAINAFSQVCQGLADFYWLLWDQNVDSIGMGLTDKIIYLEQRQAHLKKILSGVSDQESF